MMCALCRVREEEKERVVYEDALVFVVINHYLMREYHAMVLPVRCVPDMHDLSDEESGAIMRMTDRVMRTVEELVKDGVRVYVNGHAYRTQGQHLHVHVIPSANTLYGLYEITEGIPPREPKSRRDIVEAAKVLEDALLKEA